MTDIFREVDDDLRREQFKAIWKRYGNYFIALAILVVAVTAGIRAWQYWQSSRAASTGDRFVAAMKLASDGKQEDAAKAFDAIAKDGTGDYPALAQMRAASAKAEAGDTKGAAAGLDAVAANGQVPAALRDAARLRAALLLVDTAPLADLQGRIGILATPGNQFRHTAREILGLSAWKNGVYDQAQKYFEDIANDQQAPQPVSQRAEMMLDLIRARTGQTAPAGTAPAPTSPAPNLSAPSPGNAPQIFAPAPTPNTLSPFSPSIPSTIGQPPLIGPPSGLPVIPPADLAPTAPPADAQAPAAVPPAASPPAATPPLAAEAPAPPPAALPPADATPPAPTSAAPPAPATPAPAQ